MLGFSMFLYFLVSQNPLKYIFIHVESKYYVGFSISMKHVNTKNNLLLFYSV